MKRYPLGRARIPAHIVEEGETLTGIARRELGDVRLYSEIARVNKIRDPNMIYAGDILILPRRPIWL